MHEQQQREAVAAATRRLFPGAATLVLAWGEGRLGPVMVLDELDARLDGGDDAFRALLDAMWDADLHSSAGLAPWGARFTHGPEGFRLPVQEA